METIELSGRTGQEVYEELKHRLEGMGYLPDEYFLLDADWEDRRVIPRNADLFCTTACGDSEGIYLDVYLKWYGEDGKPVEWEIRCISSDEYAKIRSSCIKQVPMPGKKGQYTQTMDSYALQSKLCARCTVFPDLNSAELQNSWGVVSAEALLGKLLTPGEFEDYAGAVFEANGFTLGEDPMEQLVDDAKN